MLFLVFLFFLLRDLNVDAVPLQVHARDFALVAEGVRTRTMFDIVWACLSTTFICAWVSVHPNVPPPTTEEYGWKSLLRRLKLMFWAILAPELILLWSVRQWLAAGEIAQIYNNQVRQDGVQTFLSFWLFVHQ